MAPVTRGKDQEPMKTEQNAKITLYWLEKSRSQRILWLLEELPISYSLETYKRQNMLAPPELKEIHPLGKSPLVSIATGADSKPLVLAESSFIVEYLIEHFGPWLAPERYEVGKGGEVGGETESWMRYRYYMHFAEGSLMPFLIVAFILSNIKTSTPFFIRPLALMITGALESKFLHPNLKTQFDFLESQLATSPNDGEYLCGADLTGADIMMSFPLGAYSPAYPHLNQIEIQTPETISVGMCAVETFFKSQGVFLVTIKAIADFVTSLCVGAAKSRGLFTEKEHPKLCAYVDRLEAMEGFKKAVQKIVDVEGSYEGL